MSVREAYKDAMDLEYLRMQAEDMHNALEDAHESNRQTCRKVDDLHEDIDALNCRIAELEQGISSYIEVVKEQEEEIDSLKLMLQEHGYGPERVGAFVEECKRVEAAYRALKEQQELFDKMVRDEFEKSRKAWGEWNAEHADERA